MTATEKTCNRCGETKPLDLFVKRSDSKDGRGGRCKACESKRVGAWFRDHPEVVREHNQRAYWKDPEKSRARGRAQSRKRDPNHRRTVDAAWRDANRDKIRDRDARRRAAKRGQSTGPVDMAAVLASRPDCYLCGAELSGTLHADHVVPLSRGGAHHPDNLEPTHERCNLRKSDRLLSELDWYTGPTDLGVSVVS